MKRGRPAGAREQRAPGVLPGLPRKLITGEAKADYQAPDPDTLIQRQLSMLGQAQMSVRVEMTAGMQRDGGRICLDDCLKLEKLSSAIARSVDTLKKSQELTQYLDARRSPDELLEAALAKVEAQTVPTIRYAIKRLRACLERLAPNSEASGTAVEALSSLAE